jgi:hypothetical protein
MFNKLDEIYHSDRRRELEDMIFDYLLYEKDFKYITSVSLIRSVDPVYQKSCIYTYMSTYYSKYKDSHVNMPIFTWNIDCYSGLVMGVELEDFKAIITNVYKGVHRTNIINEIITDV